MCSLFFFLLCNLPLHQATCYQMAVISIKGHRVGLPKYGCCLQLIVHLCSLSLKHPTSLQARGLDLDRCFRKHHAVQSTPLSEWGHFFGASCSLGGVLEGSSGWLLSVLLDKCSLLQLSCSWDEFSSLLIPSWEERVVRRKCSSNICFTWG